MTLTLYRADGTVKDTDYLATPSALDPWHLIGAAGEPPFQNGWAQYGGFALAGFRKFPDGRVMLRGLVRDGTAGSTVFTLPIGYRPPASLIFPTTSGETPQFARADVAPSGNVNLSRPGNLWSCLDGIEFDTESVNQYVVPTGQGPPLVTALPASPTDGQEIRYLADAVNGVVWSLRYRAGSASAYKWEVVGGAPIYVFTNLDAFMAASWGVPGSGAGSVVVPLTGDYLVEFGALLYSNAAGASPQIGIGVNSTTAITGTPCMHAAFGAGYVDYGDRSRQGRYAGLAAGATLRILGQSSPAGGGVQMPWMKVTPVRVG